MVSPGASSACRTQFVTTLAHQQDHVLQDVLGEPVPEAGHERASIGRRHGAGRQL